MHLSSHISHNPAPVAKPLTRRVLISVPVPRMVVDEQICEGARVRISVHVREIFEDELDKTFLCGRVLSLTQCTKACGVLSPRVTDDHGRGVRPDTIRRIDDGARRAIRRGHASNLSLVLLPPAVFEFHGDLDGAIVMETTNGHAELPVKVAFRGVHIAETTKRHRVDNVIVGSRLSVVDTDIDALPLVGVWIDIGLERCCTAAHLDVYQLRHAV